MRILFLIDGFVRVAALAVPLAGCSGGSASPAPAGDAPQAAQRLAARVAAASGTVTAAQRSVLLPGTVIPAARTGGETAFVTGNPLRQPRVFVSDDANGVVDIFDPGTRTEVGKLTGFNQPQGVATSRDGTLYVADTGDSVVDVYDQPYSTTPTTQLADTGEFPAGVAVSNRGVLAVINVVDTTGAAGNVVFYPYQGTTPCASVSVPVTFAKVFFGAFDERGTLFVDGVDANDSTVLAKVEGGCSARAFAPLKTTNTIGYPGGIRVDKSDQIAIEDQEASQIDVYADPPARDLGAPLSTISLSGTGEVVDFALTRSTDNLFTADAVNAESIKYSYPEGGKAKIKLKVAGQPIGVAVTITEIP